MKRIILRIIIALIVGLIAYLLLWPVPINPAAWTPPTAPELTGVYAQNNELAKIERLRIDSFAPEDVEKRQTFARLAGQLKTEVARINTRISEFLNYSRPSELELEPLDLYAISQDAMRIIEAQAIESGIKTTVEKSGDIPPVMGDTEALRSMMTNLVINGVQAMDGGNGRLSILLAGEESGRRARIEVSDTGRGIAPEDISKVFEPYYSTKDTGTGLGLAIVKKAVDDHRGTINVKSKVGSGTTFIITLPARGKGERLTNGTQEHTRS